MRRGDAVYYLNGDQRLDWVDEFVTRNNLGNWFDDIRNVIESFKVDPDFSDLQGATAHMDAAILHAMQNGMRLHNDQGIRCAESCHSAGKAALAWGKFFDENALPPSERTLTEDGLIRLRLEGEQAGADYGWAYPETPETPATGPTSTTD